MPVFGLDEDSRQIQRHDTLTNYLEAILSVLPDRTIVLKAGIQ